MKTKNRLKGKVMNHIRLFFVLILFGFSALQAEKFTIDQIQKMAKENYPALKQVKLIEKAGQLKIDNLKSAYYPEISLVGQAQYQSDVTKVELKIPIPGIEIPEIPSPAKDQYKIGFNINQLIWDGGVSSALKEIESAQTSMNRQSVLVDIYSIKSKINEIFFAILLLNNKNEILKEAKKDLTEKHRLILVKVENEVMLESSANLIEAEILKLNQSIVELKASLSALKSALSEWIGQKINDGDEFEIPLNREFDENIKTVRPEIIYFKEAKNLLDKSKDIAEVKNYPKISAYAQAMYGRPGLNMFDNDFQPFAIAGIRANWLIWNWNNSLREKEILNTQQGLIETQEESFNRSISIQSKKLVSDIEKFDELLKVDEQIIRLRESIEKTSSVQLLNGAITPAEYITDFTALMQSVMVLDLHKMERDLAKYNLIILHGE